MDSLLRGLAAFWPLYEAAGTRVNMVAPGTDDLSVNIVGDPGGGAGILATGLTGGGTGKATPDPATTVNLQQQDWTVSFWMNIPVLAGTAEGPNQWTGAGRNKWVAHVVAGVPQLVISNDCVNATVILNAAYLATAGEWFNVVAQMDDVNDLIYLWANGVRTAAAWALAMCANVGPFNVGRVVDAGGIAHQLCEVGVWKRLLTPNEIIEGLWNRGRGSSFPFRSLRTPVRGHEASLGRRRTRFGHAMRM